MSNFVPSVERQIIWGYTEEQIMERWDLWQRWDSLYRLFGEGDSGSQHGRIRSKMPKPTIEGKALDMFLDKLQ